MIKFNYKKYKLILLIEPIVQIIMWIFSFLFVMSFLFPNYYELSKIVGIVFLIFVFLSALVLAIRRLKYGIYLIKENPNQSLKVYGTIENIAIVDRYAPHKYKVKIIEDDRIYAHWITISGVNYYLMFRKNLQIGDKVEITYLPKSKIVLEVNIIETE